MVDMTYELRRSTYFSHCMFAIFQIQMTKQGICAVADIFKAVMAEGQACGEVRLVHNEELSAGDGAMEVHT